MKLENIINYLMTEILLFPFVRGIYFNKNKIGGINEIFRI